jgi:hypothetical protein
MVVALSMNSTIQLLASSIRYFPLRSAPTLIINVYLQATGGFYEFAQNRIDGAVIGMDLSSPRVAVLKNWDRPANDGELPELAYCADIYWHYWAHNNPNVKNLRIYGTNNVINVNIVKLVARALKNRNTALATWPGTSFEAGTEEFKAQIGT